MNSLAIILFWMFIQVTFVSLIALALYYMTRRIGPAAGSFISLVALLTMGLIVVCSFNRWPSWFEITQSPAARSVDASQRSGRSEAVNTEPSADDGSQIDSSERNVGDENREATETLGSTFIVRALALLEELKTPDQVTRPTESWDWKDLLTGAIIAAAVIGVTRFIVGVVSVEQYRRRSVLITDEKLSEQLTQLAKELGCRRAIALKESSQLSGPATIGWLRPLILLPVHWREWSSDERRAVLAHELAHIRHRDYLTWIVAQLGLLLNFYHPLAHWLGRCLRLDQELLADSVAAKLIGDKQTYLQSLARIALNQPELPVQWPARTFLPTRRTFLRRIEMLRDSNQLLVGMPRLTRWSLSVVLVLTGLAAIGLRAPAPFAPEIVRAQQQDTRSLSETSQEAKKGPLTLAYVPRDAIFVVGVRPSALVNRPVLKPLVESLRMAEVEKALGVKLGEVEAFHTVALPTPGSDFVFGQAFIVRLTSTDAENRLLAPLLKNATKETYGTEQYFETQTGFIYQGKDRTVLIAPDKGIIRRCIVAGQAGTSRAKWAEMWSEVHWSDAAALINSESLKTALAYGPPGQPYLPVFVAPYAPLWDDTDIILGSLDASDQLNLQLVAKSKETDLRRVHETLIALRTLHRNSLSMMRQSISNSHRDDGPAMLASIDVADELLENVEIRGPADGKVVVNLRVKSEDSTRLVNSLVPSILRARESAQRLVSANNTKQLALAMLNYEATYRHFPPAVFYSPNDVPRSWRVELLPYLGQTELYKQYRQDEPWDSENNLKVLNQMPAVFRNPQGDPASVNTCFFVLTGKGTMFDGRVGTRMQDVHDGTSNTFLIVEADRDIPWTKPEDISFNPEKPIEKLGRGGDVFVVATADGAVHTIRQPVEWDLLRPWITKAEYQVARELPK